MNDIFIKNKIMNYLNRHPLFNFSGINILVKEGNVTLFGTVLTPAEKVFAEAATKQIVEVKKVNSKLELLSDAKTLRLPPIEKILENYSKA